MAFPRTIVVRRREERWSAPVAVTAAFFGGLVVGALAWGGQMRRCRRDLFGPNRIGRLAALGHLSGQPGVETARLLLEYVRWETEPLLRRRAERLLERMQPYLD